MIKRRIVQFLFSIQTILVMSLLMLLAGKLTVGKLLQDKCCQSLSSLLS